MFVDDEGTGRRTLDEGFSFNVRGLKSRPPLIEYDRLCVLVRRG